MIVGDTANIDSAIVGLKMVNANRLNLSYVFLAVKLSLIPSAHRHQLSH